MQSDPTVMVQKRSGSLGATVVTVAFDSEALAHGGASSYMRSDTSTFEPALSVGLRTANDTSMPRAMSETPKALITMPSSIH